MRSDAVKKGNERAPHRSLLYATGLKKEDIKKPFIAVCNSYTNIVPGHCKLNKVGQLISEEIKKAGPPVWGDWINRDLFPTHAMYGRLSDADLKEIFNGQFSKI